MKIFLLKVSHIFIWLCLLINGFSYLYANASTSSNTINPIESLFQKGSKENYQKYVFDYSLKTVDQKVIFADGLQFRPPRNWKKINQPQLTGNFALLAKVLQDLSPQSLIFSKQFNKDKNSQTLLAILYLPVRIANNIVKFSEKNVQAQPIPAAIERQNILIGNQKVIEIKIRDTLNVSFLFLLAAPSLTKATQDAQRSVANVSDSVDSADRYVFLIAYFVSKDKFINEVEAIQSSVSTIKRWRPNFIKRFFKRIRNKIRSIF